MGFGSHFVDDEYLEHIREYATLFTTDVQYIRSMIEAVPFFHLEPAFQSKAVQVLNTIIENVGSATANIKGLRYSQNMTEAYKLHARMREYENIIGCVSEAAFQRFEGYCIEQPHFYVPTGAEYRSKRVYKAVDKLVSHFLNCFFPPDQRQELITITFFGETPMYQIRNVRNLAIIQLPKMDLTRCRFWACLGHETAHERFAHTTLGGEYKTLKRRIIDALMKMGKKNWRMSPSFAEACAEAQFEEIICDLSSLMVSGLPDLMTLIIFFSYPKLDAGDFGRHPPLDVRMGYMYRYLSGLESDDQSYYSLTLEGSKSSWESIKRDLEKSYQLSNSERRYIRDYSKLIDTYYTDLIDLARNFIVLPGNQLFSPSIWQRAKEAYDQIISTTDLKDLNLSYTELINLVWVKRCEVFATLSSLDHSTERFLVWHEYERKLFEEFVNTLIEM